MGDKTVEYLEKKHNKVVLSIEEVAAEFGVSQEDIQDIVETGELQSKKIGSKLIFSIASIAKYIDCDNEDICQQTADKSATDTVSSQQVEAEKANIELVEDEVEMKGNITHLKDGRWMYQIDIGKTADGKRIRESKGFRTAEAAREALEKRLAELDAEQKVSDKAHKNMTFEAYLNYYLALERGRGTSLTKAGYYNSAKHIVAKLGNFKLHELNSDTILKFFKDIKADFAQATLSKIYLVLNMSLNYAYKKHLIDEDIMFDVKNPKSTKRLEKKEHYLSNKDLQIVLEKVKAYPELDAVIEVFVATGMRAGEFRALEWKNLDVKAKTMKITNAATVERKIDKIGAKGEKKKVIGDTKSTYSRRVLNLSDTAVEALKKWRDYVNTNSAYKYARDSKYIFTGKNGDFQSDNALRVKYNNFLKAEELVQEKYNFHNYRHTLCTNLILKGVDIPTIQRILGDNTTSVIMGVYTHINQDNIKQAAQSVFNDLAV